jgi:PHD/YefM family antitoxin component YafN of YafNO toxin-antitoxin module
MYLKGCNMATFNSDEIYTATEMVRNFSSILKSITSKEKKRAFIVKNNKFEAVVLNMDEYEKLNDAFELLQKLYKKTKKA